METEIAIIGAGPAGMAAALQLKRYGIEALLFEKHKKTNSLLKNAWQVENYLGFKAKSGPELLQNFQQHLAQYGINPIFENVLQIDYNDKFIIKTSHKIYSTQYLIIASGTKPKKLDSRIRGNDGEICKYEIFPLLKEQNKTIAIIGAGDAAFDYALNLAENNQVFLFNKGKNIKALPLLVDKMRRHKNIIYKENHMLEKIAKGAEKSLLLTFTGQTYSCDFLLAAIGRIPQKDFYAVNLTENENKLISTEYLHLAGDVKNAIYRQTSIAVADGIYAAMKIYNHIKGESCT